MKMKTQFIKIYGKAALTGKFIALMNMRVYIPRRY